MQGMFGKAVAAYFADVHASATKCAGGLDITTNSVSTHVAASAHVPPEACPDVRYRTFVLELSS